MDGLRPLHIGCVMVGVLHWDSCVDSDGDGITDVSDNCIQFSNPLQQDTDGDGIPDDIEVAIAKLDPLDSDSDGDGLPDGDEDQDGDGLINSLEVVLGTDLTNPDNLQRID